LVLVDYYSSYKNYIQSRRIKKFFKFSQRKIILKILIDEK
jgi:hypothetical protein